MLNRLLLALLFVLCTVLPAQAVDLFIGGSPDGAEGTRAQLNARWPASSVAGGIAANGNNTAFISQSSTSSLAGSFNFRFYHSGLLATGGNVERQFTQTATEVWLTWTDFWEPGFQTSPTCTTVPDCQVGTKNGLYLRGSNSKAHQFSHWTWNSRTMNLHCQSCYDAHIAGQEVPAVKPHYDSWQLPQNQGVNFSHPDAHHVCYEWRIKLNAPGVADGIQQLYVTDLSVPGFVTRLVASYTGLEMRGPVSDGTSVAFPHNQTFNALQLFRQFGTGVRHIDQVSATTTRAGCSGTPPVTDTTAPTPPTITSAVGGAGSVSITHSTSTDGCGTSCITYFRERCTGAACTNFAPIGSGTSTSFTSSGLADTTLYRFRVQAGDPTGNLSAWSNIAEATTTTPSPSGSLSITANGKFAVNGVETFLLGVSYFDVDQYHTSDLDTLAARGFNLWRIFANWNTDGGHGPARSVCDANGALVAARRDQIQAFIDYAKTKTAIVQMVILDTNSPLLMVDDTKRQACVTNVVNEYESDWNVMFDVVQEHDTVEGDPGTVWTTADTAAESKTWTDVAKAACSTCIIYSSATINNNGFGDFIGPNSATSVLTAFNKANVTTKIQTNNESVLAVHEARNTTWYNLTGARVTEYRTHLASIGKSGVPVVFDEPQRDATAAQFTTAAVQARDAGAASWVFHNNDCFDLRTLALFQQLSVEEVNFTTGIAAALSVAPGSGTTPTVLAGSSDTFTRANSAELGTDWLPGFPSTLALNLVGNAVQATTLGSESIEVYTGAASTPASLYTCTGANEGPPPTGFLTKSGNGLKRFTATSSCGWDSTSSPGVIDSIVWNADFADDQEVQATMSALPTGTNVDFANLIVRAQATSGGYDNLYNGTIFANGTNYTMELNKFVAGVQTTMTSTTGSVSVNDVFLLRAVGSQITLYQNGVARLTTSDPTGFLTGGYIGMGSFRSALATTVRWKSFSGGSYTASFSTPNNQGRTVTLGTVGGTAKQYGAIALRHTTPPAAWNGYLCEFTTNPSAIQLRKKTGGSGSDLTTITTVSPDWTTGDVIGCFVSGSTLYATRGSVTSAPIATTTTDGVYTSGHTGLYVYAPIGSTITNLTIASTDGYEYTTPPPACTPSITSAVTTTAGATVTWPSSCPPTQIRVRTQIGASIEPLSAFPSGVYTKVGGWPPAANNGAFQCFDAINSQGVINTTDYVCTSFQPAYDDQPAILSNPQPNQILPAGTTSRTISVQLNKASTTCKTGQDGVGGVTSATAYASLPTSMNVAGLTASYLVTGLTDGTTARWYFRCNFTDVVGVEHPNTTSVFADVIVATPADVLPPVVTSFGPSGELPHSTTTVPFAVQISENGTCKGSHTTGVAYASMAITFTGTGTMSHTYSYTPVSNGQSGTLYVLCTDGTNVMTTELQIPWSVGVPPDLSPATRSAGLPSGVRAAGTASEVMSLTTDAASNCNWSAVAGTAYSAMTNTFGTTGGTSHSTTITTGIDNQFYRHFVRCSKTSNSVVNDTDYEISWYQDLTPGDVTAPDAPTEVVAQIVSETQVDVVFEEVTDAGGIAGYKVYGCFVDGCTPDTLMAGPTLTIPVQLTGLVPFLTGTFHVTAVDTSGNESVASNTFTVQTPPPVDVTPPPDMTNLRLLAAFLNSVLVTFDEGVDTGGGGVRNIIYKCQGAACTNFEPTQAPFDLEVLVVTLDPNTLYRICGRYVDDAGNISANCSNILEVTTTATGLSEPRTPVPVGFDRDTATRSDAGTRTPRP